MTSTPGIENQLMQELPEYWAFSILRGDKTLWFEEYETYITRK